MSDWALSLKILYHVATYYLILLCIYSVDGQWGPFGNWSSCSQSCGNGTQTRKRECNNPPPSNGGADCKGNATDQRNCKITVCPGKKNYLQACMSFLVNAGWSP